MKSQDILILLKIISMHIDLNRQNFDSDTFHLYESKVDWGICLGGRMLRESHPRIFL